MFPFLEEAFNGMDGRGIWGTGVFSAFEMKSLTRKTLNDGNLHFCMGDYFELNNSIDIQFVNTRVKMFWCDVSVLKCMYS